MKKTESYLHIDEDVMYVRHNIFNPKRTSLIFVHGLGSSGLDFADVLKDDRFNEFNIFIPDLIGYGRSSCKSTEDGYSYDSHVKRLDFFIKEKNLTDIILIGHSMGGDITTLLCESHKEKNIRKFVNVEGDISQFDPLLSAKAVMADKRGEFYDWFDSTFLNSIVFRGMGRTDTGKKYFASLKFCRPEAYIENSKELVRRNTCLEGKYKSEIGQAYISLEMPKIFCYGAKSLADGSLNFLKDNNLKTKEFIESGHSPMSDVPEEFYNFLYDYIIE